MKILIVEDSDPKLKAVRAIVDDVLKGCDVEEVCSFVEASQALTRCDFELVILDIVIPLRSDRRDSRKEHGLALLDEMFDGGDVRPPNHIVCLSEFADQLSTFEGDSKAAKLVHMVKYDETEAGWAELLRSKLEYVHRRVEKSNAFPTDFLADVAIVVSYPPVELEAVLGLPGQYGGEFNKIDELWYYRACWKNGDRVLNVVACAAPAMGMTAACVTASKIIARWRPRFIAMSGIAAGTDDSLAFGDVLLAEYCYDYGSGKIRDQENGERFFVPSPQQLSLDSQMKPLLQRWEAEQRGMLEVGKMWDRSGSFVPKLKLGVLASGAAVVQSKSHVEEIKSHSRKVVGLEMEAYGIFQAAALSSCPKPRVLVAKAVSDFADHQKDDSAQKMAAFTSAQFVYSFFTGERDIWT